MLMSFISFELFLMAFKGIRNTTTVFDNPERDRIRLVNFLNILSVPSFTDALLYHSAKACICRWDFTCKALPTDVWIIVDRTCSLILPVKHSVNTG
jgi:hypothetical protein